jgi:hypothetical protein
MTRHDIGRDKFTHKIWDWKQQSGGTITSQMQLEENRFLSSQSERYLASICSGL